VFEFWYLGHLFQADGDPFHALEVRAAQAKTAGIVTESLIDKGKEGSLHAGVEVEVELAVLEAYARPIRHARGLYYAASRADRQHALQPFRSPRLESV